MTTRFVKFNLAGALGIAVHLGMLAVLSRQPSVYYLAATVLALSAAVLHNFVWHWRWTWRDRALPLAAVPGALGRFVCANGLVSLASHLGVVGLLVERGALDPLPANAVAIAAAGLINFHLTDRAVFLRRGRPASVGSNPARPAVSRK